VYLNLKKKSTQVIHGLNGCITPSRVIILRSNAYMHGPIIVMDRMNPGTPHKLLDTPGMKCKSENGRYFSSTLFKSNHLMVLIQRNCIFLGKDDTILISFWDLRGEPYLLKEQNVIDMIPSEILSEKELGDGCRGEIYDVDIKLSRAIMAVYLVIRIIHQKNERFQFITLLYRVNTAEPSQDPAVLHLVKIVMLHNSSRSGLWQNIHLNDKYLIFPNFFHGDTDGWEVNEIQTLLSALDTRLAPRKDLPHLAGEYALEPGMSDRLAVFDYEGNHLTILDLVSKSPITKVDTIQWSIIGQPSEKYDSPDKNLKIKNIYGIWCCGSFLTLQRLELPNRCKKHRQWTFKLNLVDPGTREKRPEVISTIKDIFDSSISYPEEIEEEEWCIDVMGLVYMVSESDVSDDVGYLTVNCAQFHNINAAQARCIGAFDDFSSNEIGVSNIVDAVVNWMGHGEDRVGEEEEGKVGEETEGKDKGDGFHPGTFLSHLLPY
jgi:hypothetical protein